MPCTLSSPLDLPSMPAAFRLTSLRSAQTRLGLTHWATLFHERASLKVQWTGRSHSSGLHVGAIVSPRWWAYAECVDGAVTIAGLSVWQRPSPKVALFDLVPWGWFADRSWLARTRDLVSELPAPYRHLFNAVLWDGERLRRFCQGPSSIQNHHSGDGDNLRHTVETAEFVRHWCMEHAFAHRDLAVLTALLHDVGKAMEYSLRPDGSWGLSDRGRLLGHKITAIEWVAAALAQWGIALPPMHAEVLLHNLSAAAHAPKYLGLREPQTLEAFVVSLADRSSGTAELLQRCLPRAGGWGAYHSQLGFRPYRLAPSATSATSANPAW